MSRELDERVAREVMNLSTEHLPLVWEEGSTVDGLDGWNGFVCPRCKGSSDLGLCVKYYSSDIRAVWEVLRKLGEKGWYFSVQLDSDGLVDGLTLMAGDSNCPYNRPYNQEDGHGFSVVEWPPEDLDDIKDWMFEFPAALCLAALETVKR